MRVIFSRKFQKMYGKLQPSKRSLFDHRLVLFMADPSNSMLRKHYLSGKYSGCLSINIGGDIRAIYREESKGVSVFVAIGTHSELYE